MVWKNARDIFLREKSRNLQFYERKICISMCVYPHIDIFEESTSKVQGCLFGCKDIMNDANFLYHNFQIFYNSNSERYSNNLLPMVV